jgi:hypothetical protein
MRGKRFPVVGMSRLIAGTEACEPWDIEQRQGYDAHDDGQDDGRYGNSFEYRHSARNVPDTPCGRDNNSDNRPSHGSRTAGLAHGFH